jgi:hypothetical protein
MCKGKLAMKVFGPAGNTFLAVLAIGVLYLFITNQNATEKEGQFLLDHQCTRIATSYYNSEPLYQCNGKVWAQSDIRKIMVIEPAFKEK